jgi:hypothetical protein
VSDSPADVRDLLNAQTGRIGWPELQRHFARGVVLAVAPGLDLVEVAASVVEDDAAKLRDWLDSGAVTRAELAHARRWQAEQTRFWAVVAAPWVLVQVEDTRT